MPKHEIISLVFRSLLSLIALLGLLYLQISNVHCETDQMVVIILGGTIMGMNGKELLDLYAKWKAK